MGRHGVRCGLGLFGVRFSHLNLPKELASWIVFGLASNAGRACVLVAGPCVVKGVILQSLPIGHKGLGRRMLDRSGERGR